MHWRDLLDDQHDNRGLGLIVDAATPSQFAVEAGFDRMIRIVARETPRAWARVERDNYGYVYLRTQNAESLGAVPPIAFTTAREIESLSDWSRFFADALSRGTASPIDRGLSFVGPCNASLSVSLGKHPVAHRFQAPPAKRLENVPSLRSCDYAQWDLHELPPLPMRDLSPDDDGRVKAFRKLAREGHLPPVLLFWVAGLERYVLVDGHDRLLASILEGVAPNCIAIVHVRQAEHGRVSLPQDVVGEVVAAASSTESANAVVRQLFDERPKLVATTRARAMMKSSVEVWYSDVRHELSKRNDVDKSDAELLLE